MRHSYPLLILAICIFALTGCNQQPRQVRSAEAQLIPVDSTLDNIQDTAYLRLLEPTTKYLNEQMDVVIGHAPMDLTVKQPECTMLNWACDALYDMAVEKTARQVDFSVVNIGGMRQEWQAGDITRRNVFELMPFDNRLVILTLSGKDVLDLCEVYASQGGQGFSRQMRMEIRNKKAQNVRLNGKKIVPEAMYYIATSDYLSGGADHFTPLTRYVDRYESGLKIRDLYMEYVETNKEVTSRIDGRMKIKG